MPPQWKCKFCGALNKKGRCVSCKRSVSCTVDIAFEEMRVLQLLNIQEEK